MVMIALRLRFKEFEGVLVLQQWPALLKTGLTKVPKIVGISVLTLIKDIFALQGTG